MSLFKNKGRTTKTVSKKDENLELQNDSFMECEMTDPNNNADEETLDDDDLTKGRCCFCGREA